MQKNLLEFFTNDSKFKIEKTNLNSNINNIDEDTILNNFVLTSPIINSSKNGSLIEEKIIYFKNNANQLSDTIPNNLNNNSKILKEENLKIYSGYKESLRNVISDSRTISNSQNQIFINNYFIENKLITEKIKSTNKVDINENNEIYEKEKMIKNLQNYYLINNCASKNIFVYSNKNNLKFGLNNSNNNFYSQITEFEKILKNACFSLKCEQILEIVISFFNEIQKTSKEKIYLSNGTINSYPKVYGLIGSGSYGDVYDLREVNSMVMKCFTINNNDVNLIFHALISFFREWKNLRILNHQNIIRFRGIGYKLIPSSQRLIEVGLILENLPIKISNYLNQFSDCIRKLEYKLEVIYQLVKGLNHIHSKNKIHRDIKPNNILISNLNIIKIIDFGTISEPINPLFKTLMDDVFTIAYGPPEFIRYYYLNEDVPLDYGNDIWSLGLTIIEIIFETNYIFPWVQTINDVFDNEKIINDLKNMKILHKNTEFEKYIENNFNNWLGLKLDDMFKNNLDLKLQFYSLIVACFSFKAENRIRTDKILKLIEGIIQTSSLKTLFDEHRVIRTNSSVSSHFEGSRIIGKNSFGNSIEFLSEKYPKESSEKIKNYKNCIFFCRKINFLKKFFEARRRKESLITSNDENLQKNVLKKLKFNINYKERHIELREDLKKLIKKKDIFKK